MELKFTRKILENKKYRQVGVLYGSMALGLIAGIGVSVINTRLLGPQQYGDLKFLQNLFTFSVTFLTFGLFVSGSRILAQNKYVSIKREIIGSLFILAAIVSVLLSILLFWFSFFENEIFDNELGSIIRVFSPLLFIYPFRLCMENIMQGDNRIYELSAFRLAPQILYAIVAIAFNFLVPLSLTSAMAIQFIVFGLVIIVMIVRLKPWRANIRENIKLILSENRGYGFQVYLGAIAGVATAQLGGLSVGYFINNTNVGFYSLALTIAMPLVMIPNAVGTTLFKDFANSASISRKAVIATAILSVIALMIFLLVIEELVIFLYSEDFIEVVPLAYVIAVGSIFHGFGDFVNRFLGAHGRGVYLRNGAIATGMANVFGYLVLVKVLGVSGAAMTKLVSGVIYFAAMFFYYQKYQGEKMP